jgi:tetratricopeptide (TPR) repeat protein
VWAPLAGTRWQKLLTSIEHATGRIRYAIGILLVTAAATVFALVPFDNLLLGDSFRLVNADDLMTLSSPAEYLTLHTYQFLRTMLGSNMIAYRVIAVLTGLAFAWVAIMFSRVIFERLAERIVSIVVILGLANVQFFLGYIENYAIMTVLLSLFLLTGWSSANSRKRLWLPAIALLAASAFHLSAAFLIPGLVFLFWKSYPPRRKLVCRLMAIGVVAASASAAILFHSTSGVSDIFAPLQSAEGNPYSILSLQHITDIGNLILLTSPAAAVLLISALAAPRWRALYRDRGIQFLFFGLIGSLTMLIAVDPKLGAARDWDLMSLFGIPATFLALALWRDESKARIRTRVIGMTAVAVLFAHTVPWVISNTDRKLTIDSFKSVVQKDVHYTPEYFDGDRLMAWGLMLGDAYGDHAEKERAYKLRLKAKPNDQRSWLLLERALFDQDKHTESIEALKKVTNFTTLTREQLMYYVRAQLYYNNWEFGLKALNTFPQRFPEDYEYFFLRGLIDQLRGDHAAAYQYYQRATKLQEPDIDLLIMYCAAAYEIGDRDLGKTLLLKADRLSTTEAQDEEIRKLRDLYHVD